VKFVAKERKTIDAVRWTGDNVTEVVEWAAALGLVVESGFGVTGAALVLCCVDDGDGDTSAAELWACTLHGEVEIESWAAYGGTDVYPLDDGELRRLYDEQSDVVVNVQVHGPSEFDRGFEAGYLSGLSEGGGRP
jgi:hypothetical protein